MGCCHDIVYTAAAALSSPLWGYRLLRTGKWRTDWPSRFGCGEPIAASPDDGTTRTLLIHAVSVGEVNAIRQLVDRLAASPDLRLVISTTTDTGLARASDLWRGRHDVVRYPLDFTRAVQRFLDRVKPDAVALAELEVWPNFVSECAKRAIPVAVINGRLSERSFAGYRRITALLRPTFARLAAAGVQTEAYAERFRALGAAPQRVRVLDTMKWDTAQIADEVNGANELAQEMGIDRDRPLIVAGSTGPGEEVMLARAVRGSCPPDTQLLLVPRKPERFDEVAAALPGIIRRTAPNTQPPTPNPQPRVFLLDTMGELRKAYALADVCIVGRSFQGLYGSDMIEPIALGKPTLVGPHHADFADTVAALLAGQGLIVTDQPGAAAAALLADVAKARALAAAGRQVILSRQGATQRYADLLLDVLSAARVACAEPLK